MFSRNFALILVVIFICCLFFIQVNANDPATYNSIGQLNYAGLVYLSKQDAVIEQWRALDRLEIQQAMLRVQWDDNAEDMAENAISLGNAVSVDVLQVVTGIITSMANTIKDYADHVALQAARVQKNSGISHQNVWTQQAVDARDDAYTHYKQHYDAYVAAYSGSLDLITKGGTPSQLSVDTGLSVDCANPRCSTSYSAETHGLDMIVWRARNNHKATCTIPHEYGQTSTYWDCPNAPGKCRLSYQHKVQCRGGCGTWFRATGGKPEDTSHYKGVCSGFNIPESYVKTFGSRSKLVDCPGHFYNCNYQTSANDCPFKKVHVAAGSTPPSSDPPSGSTPPSSGGSTPPSNPSPPPPPPPPEPTTVLCRVASTTGCTIRSSDGKSCLVRPCRSGCGNPYWTCYPNAKKNHETPFTCRRCGTSFTRCSNGTCTHNGRTYSYHDRN